MWIIWYQYPKLSLRGALQIKTDPYIKSKRDNIISAIQKAITVKELTPNTNTKKKITVKKLSPNKKALLHKLLSFLDFVQFKNVCFTNTSASDQFKTKIGNYNTISFLSSFSLLKYLYVLSLNFIAKKQFISQNA